MRAFTDQECEDVTGDHVDNFVNVLKTQVQKNYCDRSVQIDDRLRSE